MSTFQQDEDKPIGFKELFSGSMKIFEQEKQNQQQTTELKNHNDMEEYDTELKPKVIWNTFRNINSNNEFYIPYSFPAAYIIKDFSV